MFSAISVVIPTFNREALIVRAVLSALAAASFGDEIIVADDGSRDRTRSKLAAYADRIRFLPLPHGGAGRARNAGIAAAKNPLIAFLDSDDEWTPEHLQLHRRLLDSDPALVFSFSNFSVSSPGKPVRTRFLQHWQAQPRSWETLIGPVRNYSSFVPGASENYPVHVGSLYRSEMESDLVPTFTLVARRSALVDAEWFAEDVPVFEDWQCFGRLASCGPCAFVDRDTAMQHGHRHGRLTDESDLAKLSARLTLLERIWGSDAAFLAEHGPAYRAFRRKSQLSRVRCLLALGKLEAAREEIGRMDGSPLSYRLLSRMPEPMVRGLVSAWRWTKAGLSSSMGRNGHAT